ncbi:MAG: helix-turn-helix domain-containing protein [Actinomycetota bacterium]|nr:helix-turn-helix domain-containing protein [Actinomycetota bacterium]
MSLALLEQSLHDRRSLPPPPARRALRQAAGVSLLAVARACGVSRQAVAHWEAGTVSRGTSTSPRTSRR